MKALVLDGLGELYKCVGKAQQVITGLVTSAYTPALWRHRQAALGSEGLWQS